MPADSAMRALLVSRRSQGSTPVPQIPAQRSVHNLCRFCKDLNLTAQDFRGSRDATTAARRASFQRVLLPSVHVIRNQGCAFCKSIMSAMNGDDDDPQTWDRSHGWQLGFEWIKDGQRLQGIDYSPTLSTQRLRISANHGALPDVYLVLMAPEGLEEQFLGRMVDASKIDVPRLQRCTRLVCWVTNTCGWTPSASIRLTLKT